MMSLMLPFGPATTADVFEQPKPNLFGILERPVMSEPFLF